MTKHKIHKKEDRNLSGKENQSIPKKEVEESSNSQKIEVKPTEKLNNQISDLTHTLQRLQADFENYRKRTDKEKQENIKFACQNTVVELLPVLDNFELALKHTSNEKDFVKGIELVYAQLLEIIGKLGVKPIKALGEKFNPELHEVLMSEESKKDKNKIIEVFQMGYALNGRIIRTSKVKVTR